MMGNDENTPHHLYPSRHQLTSYPSTGPQPPFAQITTTDSNDPLLSSPSSLMHPDTPNNFASSTSSSFNTILDPPSYADAVFKSFDEDNINTNIINQINGQDCSFKSTSSSSSSPPSNYIKISVSDPQREQELNNSLVLNSNTFITYLITTLTNLPEFNGPEFIVRRRFKEIVSLSDRLSETHKGYLIPIRPDKNVVESQVMQKVEFVEHRRVELEKYLRKLAAHPVIGRSEELRVFLTGQGKFEPLVGRSGDVEVGEVGKGGGRDLMRMFKELKQSVTNDWGGIKPSVVEEDKEFLERKERMVEFEQQLSNVSQQAESLVKAQQDIGETMGQLGLAFVKLTKFETDEAVHNSQRVRAVDMKNLATASVKASRLYRELNAQTVKHLDKLHDYLGVMLALNNAFSDRSNALLTVQTLSSELSSLNSRIEKLEAASSKIFGGDRSRIRKIEELKETVRVTEDAKSCASREYEQIKENNKNELDRLEKERHDDFLSMLKGFVVNQAGYAEKMANVWEIVAEETSGYAKTGI